MSDPEMKLPEKKTCSDCIHFKRCSAMFGAKAENEYCDFHPIRYRAKESVKNDK